jgi:hypothetical protein
VGVGIPQQVLEAVVMCWCRAGAGASLGCGGLGAWQPLGCGTARLGADLGAELDSCTLVSFALRPVCTPSVLAGCPSQLPLPRCPCRPHSPPFSPPILPLPPAELTSSRVPLPGRCWLASGPALRPRNRCLGQSTQPIAQALAGQFADRVFRCLDVTGWLDGPE